MVQNISDKKISDLLVRKLPTAQVRIRYAQMFLDVLSSHHSLFGGLTLEDGVNSLSEVGDGLEDLRLVGVCRSQLASLQFEQSEVTF